MLEKIIWWLTPKSKKLEICIESCIKNKRALLIKTRKYAIRADFDTMNLEVRDVTTKV